jgi:hypothetical protein
LRLGLPFGTYASHFALNLVTEPMIALEPITPQNALIFKAIRLRALRDTPNTFSWAYAKESQLTDADWVKSAAQWSGERSVGYLPMDRGTACGIASANAMMCLLCGHFVAVVS